MIVHHLLERAFHQIRHHLRGDRDAFQLAQAL
jgi:hypothetical protein